MTNQITIYLTDDADLGTINEMCHKYKHIIDDVHLNIRPKKHIKVVKQFKASDEWRIQK